MVTQNRRLLYLPLIVLSILLIPFIAMQFTEEVNWGLGDFVIMGVLLFATGMVGDFIWRKVKHSEKRIGLLILTIIIFLLIWAELAVGIFGTPFAGS